jgi:hypothetical protein
MPGQQRWDNLDIAFSNFRAYIQRKKEPDSLSFVDLLYVSNFKGGNASITDPEAQVNQRLLCYSVIMKIIRKKFGSKKLGDLTIEEKSQLKKLTQKFIELPLKGKTKIRGFGSSYASALLCAHFPELTPILDRNVLASAKIKHSLKNGQVKAIETHYGDLIDLFYSRLSNDKKLSLRTLDRHLFNAGSKSRKLGTQAET